MKVYKNYISTKQKRTKKNLLVCLKKNQSICVNPSFVNIIRTDEMLKLRNPSTDDA